MNSSLSQSKDLAGTDEMQSMLRALQKCGTDLCIQDEYGFLSSCYFDPSTRVLNLPILDLSGLSNEDLEAFHVLEQVNGSLIVRDNMQITTLDGLRQLQSVKGRIELIRTGIKELSGLNRLRQADELVIERMPHLTTISGLTALSQNNFMSISGNPNLRSIPGLTGLKRCRNLSILNNPLLESISGFTSLAGIEQGSLVIHDNPLLCSANGFHALAGVDGLLSIRSCPRLADFRFLSCLEQAGSIEVDNTGLKDGAPFKRLFSGRPHFKGFVKFTRNSSLADILFMQGLTTVASSLYLHQNSLVNLQGLEQLRRVGASLNLSANRLEDISQLHNLKEINGILGLSNNRLQTLHGLENLGRVRLKKWGDRLMSIKFNDNRYPDGRVSLVDISALANVREASKQMMVFTDNEAGHRYLGKPGRQSIFCRENHDIRVFGGTNSAQLPLDHICDMAMPSDVPLLFPDMSGSWQKALRRCAGILPHFQPFRDSQGLAAYCRKNEISYVVGIKLISQKFLAAHGDELRGRGLRFIVNDEQTLNNCENKIFFRKFMDDHGFGRYVPQYYAEPGAIRYPCIVKPEYGSFGSGQRIIFSEQELGQVPENYVISEYIPGKVEYASHIFFLGRRICHHVTYRKTYTESFFILGQEQKENLHYQTVETPYLNIFLDILEVLHFKGLCCIDYKPVNNEPKIFEINARMGYTLASAPGDLKKMLDLYMKYAGEV